MKPRSGVYIKIDRNNPLCTILIAQEIYNRAGTVVPNERTLLHWHRRKRGENIINFIC